MFIQVRKSESSARENTEAGRWRLWIVSVSIDETRDPCVPTMLHLNTMCELQHTKAEAWRSADV